MTEYLGFLKATADKTAYSCELVSKVEHTETKLETMYGADIHRIRGIRYPSTARFNFSSCNPASCNILEI